LAWPGIRTLLANPPPLPRSRGIRMAIKKLREASPLWVCSRSAACCLRALAYVAVVSDHGIFSWRPPASFGHRREQAFPIECPLRLNVGRAGAASAGLRPSAVVGAGLNCPSATITAASCQQGPPYLAACLNAEAVGDPRGTDGLDHEKKRTNARQAPVGRGPPHRQLALQTPCHAAVGITVKSPAP